MLTPFVEHLEVNIGEDFEFEFYVEISDVVVDLTNAKVYAQIREEQNKSATLIARFVCYVDDVLTTNPAPTNNYIKITLSDTVTSAITATKGYYDVLVEDSSGNDLFYVRGIVRFVSTVTDKTDLGD